MKTDPLRSPFLVEVVDVIGEVEKMVRRFCILPDAAYLPIAVWIVATYLAKHFDCFPYLAILSPTKRCGKTRVLEVLELLCCGAWFGTSPTAAALYRMMEKTPTLLLDEVEPLRAKQRSEVSDAILAILNMGHRKGATVPRCEPPTHKVVFFPVYGPKAFACIGKLPDTLGDRSIRINVQRKRKDQKAGRFLRERAKKDAEPIVDAINAWVTIHDQNVRATYVGSSDLDFLEDRDADLWMPLFAVCAVASPDRVEELKQCAMKLSGSKQADDVDDSFPLKLLCDIRDVWKKGAENMSTEMLLDRLRALEESPWCDPKHILDSRGLSRMLKPFDVRPGTVRIGPGEKDTPKGYKGADLAEAFSRYLPPLANLSATSATTRMNTGENDDFPSATKAECGG